MMAAIRLSRTTYCMKRYRCRAERAHNTRFSMSRHETSKKLTRERELARKREARAADRTKRKPFGKAMIAYDQIDAPIIDAGGFLRKIQQMIDTAADQIFECMEVEVPIDGTTAGLSFWIDGQATHNQTFNSIEAAIEAFKQMCR
jgi:hypothetical protein